MGNKVKVIGICGKARSGKDTFARLLVGHLIDAGHEATIMALADPIRDMLVPLLRHHTPEDMTPQQFFYECFDGSLKETPVLQSNGDSSPRCMMQMLGTEWGRYLIAEDLWVKTLDRRIHNWVLADDLPWDRPPSMNSYIIVPDVRFNNEAEYMTGGVIKLVRPNCKEVNDHESENGIDDDYVQVVVYNDGSIDELSSAAKLIVDEELADDYD